MSNEQLANHSYMVLWYLDNYNPHLVGGFNQRRLKNIRQNGFIFPNARDEI